MATTERVIPVYANEAISIFEKDLAIRELSDETIRGYYLDSKQFITWLIEINNAPVPMQSITVHQVEEFVQYLLKERECMPRTVNRKLNALSMFFQCMKQEKILDENPLDEIERLKVSNQERTYLSREEVEAIIKAITHPVVHYFALTMAYTGIRVNECIQLKISDVDFKDDCIQIVNGKGGKDRSIPMSSYLAEQLKIYLEKHRPETDSLFLFATKQTGTVSAQYVNRLLLEASQTANIEKHVTSHMLRHSFASYLVTKDTHVAVIQKLLGHANLKTTSIYLHVEEENLKEAIESIDF